jgi:hypothetical protein
VRPLVEQAAVRMLPLPVRTTLAQLAIEMPPSVKFTVPVGPTPLTLAVNVTLALAVEGFALVARPVVVVVALTICDSAPLVDDVLPALPP